MAIKAKFEGSSKERAKVGYYHILVIIIIIVVVVVVIIIIVTIIITNVLPYCLLGTICEMTGLKRASLLGK